MKPLLSREKMYFVLWASIQAAHVASFDVGVGAGTLMKPRGLWKSTFLLPEREVKVWLPPGYDEDDQTRYPVLYVHDGQNAMEDSTSWTGHSWQLGAALTKLLEDGAIEKAPIVVMIDNAPGDAFGMPMMRRRHLEYGDGWLAKPYRNHVATVVKPAIDANYRTLAGPEHTAQLGTSLGGAAAFLAAWEMPEVFGNAACLSPAFSAATLAEVAASAAAIAAAGATTTSGIGGGAGGSRLIDRSAPEARLQHARIYLDNGGDADGKTVPMLDSSDVMDAAFAAMVAARGAASAIPLAAQLNPGYFWLDAYLQLGVSAMVSLLQFHGLRLMEEATHPSSSNVPMVTTAGGSGRGDAIENKQQQEDSNPLLSGVASMVTAWRNNNIGNNNDNDRISSSRSPSLSSRGGWLAYHRAAGARHNERAWAERITRPLLHLYATEEKHEGHT